MAGIQTMGEFHSIDSNMLRLVKTCYRYCWHVLSSRQEPANPDANWQQLRSPQHPHGRNPDHGGMIQAEPSLIKTCWFDVVSWNHWPYSYSTWFWLVAFELFTVFFIGKMSTTKMYLNSCGYKSLTDLRFGYLSPAGEDQCLFLSCVMLPVCQHWCVNNQVNVNECRYHQALQHANSLSTGSFSAQN